MWLSRHFIIVFKKNYLYTFSTFIPPLGKVEPNSTFIPPLGKVEPNSTLIPPLGKVEPNSTFIPPLGKVEPNSTFRKSPKGLQREWYCGVAEQNFGSTFLYFVRKGRTGLKRLIEINFSKFRHVFVFQNMGLQIMFRDFIF
jgi:hypothetical protein